jgi:Flp pilus assembly protein TadD
MTGIRPIGWLIFAGLTFSAWGAPPGAPGLTLGPSADLTTPGEKKAPDEAQKIARRALATLAKGDLESAKRDFLKVLQLVPDNVTTTINLGLIEYRQKNYPEAERLLDHAVRLQPENGLGWLLLGVIEYDQDKLDFALAALAQAVLWEPKNAMAHHYLGVTVGKKGWYSGAEDEMRKAIELQPNYAEAHFNLAVFYLQRNPPAVELARRHYQKARDLGAAPDYDVEKSLGPPSP